MFKFELGQTVYFLKDNKICSDEVWCRMKVENFHSLDACTTTQDEFYYPFGQARIQYALRGDIYLEEDLFESKEALIKHLLEE